MRTSDFVVSWIQRRPGATHLGGVRVRARSRLIFGLGISLLIVAAAFGGWVLRGSSDQSAAASEADVKAGVATIVTPSQLEEFATNHAPLYWAGERAGTKLELTLTTKDAIFVRYLPEDAHAGDTGQYLTVGTYGDIDGYS